MASDRSVVKNINGKRLWKDSLKDICEVARISLHNLVSSNTPPLPVCYSREFEKAALLLGKDEVLEMVSNDAEKHADHLKNTILKAKNRIHDAKEILQEFDGDVRRDIEEISSQFDLLNKEFGNEEKFSNFLRSAEALKEGSTRLVTNLSNVIEQISRQEAILGCLAKQIYEDPLTGTYNRRAWDKDLKELAESLKEDPNATFSMAIVDLDKFKDINDTHGHLVGDAVLQQFARLLKDHFKNKGTVYRYGGDEFAVLAPGVTLDEMIDLLELFRAKLKKSVFVIPNAKVQIKLTSSIGVAQWEKGLSIKEIIQIADEKLYNAKEAGRDCVKW